MKDHRRIAVEALMEERGMRLRGVTWAPGAERLTPEQRQEFLLDLMERILRGEGTKLEKIGDAPMEDYKIGRFDP
jgi:hypothetical protein